MRLKIKGLVFAAICAAFGTTTHAATISSTYSGGSANWTTAAWVNTPSGGSFPNDGGGTTYDATYSGGSILTLDQAISIQKFTLTNSGTVTGTFNLTTADTLHWTGGTMSGAAVTNANGSMSIDGFQNFLDTRTLNIANSTTANFTGNGGGIFYLFNSAIVNNAGTFDSGWAANLNNSISPNGTSGTFNNTGTFTRSVGNGATTVTVPFNSSNIVNVQIGTLSLNGGGTDSGSFQVANNALLEFGGTTSIAAGTTSSGAGNININGTVTVTGTTGNFAATLTLNGGTLNGSGTMVSTGLLHWKGGTMGGNGVTNANGSMSIDGFQNFLDTRTLNIANSTTANFTGNGGGIFYLFNSAIVNNAGTFDSGWAANLNNSISPNGTSGTFNNTGTFTRSVGNGATTVTVPFNSSNIVNVQIGTLSLNGGGTDSGSFQVANNALLEFGGTTSIAAGTTSSGAGNININGTVTVTGTTGNFAATLTLNGGTLNGSGTMVSTGLLHWKGGTMGGNGVTNANGSMSIDGFQNFLDTRTLNIANSTTANFTGNGGGIFYLFNSAIVNNAGTFDSGWAANLNNSISPNGTSGTFNNTGTFTRSVGNGATTVTVPFNNTGLVNVQAGTIAFNGTYSQTAGKLTTQTGAFVSFASPADIFAGIVAGTGTVSSQMTLENGATLAPGNSIGTLNTQALILMNSTHLDYEFGASGISDLTAVTGNLTLDGILNFTPASGFPGTGTATYTLFTYTGTLTDNGLALASSPYFANPSINTSNHAVTLTITALPEPSTFILGGIGLLGLLSLIAKRRK